MRNRTIAIVLGLTSSLMSTEALADISSQPLAQTNTRVQDHSDLPGHAPGTDVTILESTYTQVIPLLEDQITLLRQQLGDQHPELASQLELLGALYLMQQRYEAAEFTLNEALDIYRSYPGEYDSQIASILDLLSGIAYSQEQLDTSVALSQAALNGQRDTPDGLTIQTATPASLAFSLQAQGRHAEAENLLLENIDLFKEQSDPLDIAFAIDLLADFYHIQSQYAKAEDYYRQALAVRKESSTDDFEHPSLSTSLNNLALLYQSQGQYTEAEPLYKQALDIYDTYLSFLSENTPASEEFVNNQQRFTVPVFYNLAGLYRAMGETRNAIATLQAGLAIEERDLDFSLANLGDADRQSYVEKVKNSFNYVLSLHLNSAPESTDATAMALTHIFRRKGRILDAGTRTFEIIRQHGTLEDKKLLQQFIKTKQHIANLTTDPVSGLSAADYQRRLASLRSESNRLENILARRSTLLAPTTPAIELSAIQNQIPAKGVLIEYVLYQPFDPTQPVSNRFSATSGGPAQQFEAPHYAAYLFFPDGTIKAVDLGDAAQIDRAIQSFGNVLKSHNPGSSRATIRVEIAPERNDAIVDEIRQLVLDPIAPYLENQQHLLISPDSQLNRLPFEALKTEKGQYLVEKYQISYLNSGRDLLKLNADTGNSGVDIILANPNYGESIASSSSNGNSLNSLGEFASLPGTAAEAASLASLLPKATLLTENNATEAALKQIQSPRILHLATHGFFLPDVEPQADPLLRSGLALAGINPRTGGGGDNGNNNDDDNGILTALEAANLNLTGTQLVVLSACDTGLGEIASGEGVYGLRRAFSIAGADTQLMSLWQVSDFGTQRLMTQYYKNLTAGMGRSEALRATQLDMIHSNSDYAHPYYWAAFILAGDWRPLEYE